MATSHLMRQAKSFRFQGFEMFLWIDDDEVPPSSIDKTFDPAWLDGFPVLTIQDTISEEVTRG